MSIGISLILLSTTTKNVMTHVSVKGKNKKIMFHFTEGQEHLFSETYTLQMVWYYRSPQSKEHAHSQNESGHLWPLKH